MYVTEYEQYPVVCTGHEDSFRGCIAVETVTIFNDVKYEKVMLMTIDPRKSKNVKK